MSTNGSHNLPEVVRISEKSAYGPQHRWTSVQIQLGCQENNLNDRPDVFSVWQARSACLASQPTTPLLTYDSHRDTSFVMAGMFCSALCVWKYALISPLPCTVAMLFSPKLPLFRLSYSFVLSSHVLSPQVVFSIIWPCFWLSVQLLIIS